MAQTPERANDEQYFNDIHGPVGQRKGAFYKDPAFNIGGGKATETLNQLRKGECCLSH
jgi:hypothetical protein